MKSTLIDDTFIPFEITPSSGEPIYRQLIAQIRRMIASNKLLPGTSLPSTNQLALQLSINPVTISKAYSLLKAEGLLEELNNNNMMVSIQQPVYLVQNERIKLLKPSLDKLVADAKQLDIENNLVIQELNKLLSYLPQISENSQSSI